MDEEDTFDEEDGDAVEGESKRLQCVGCRKELAFGFDVMQAQLGVVGPKGFVDIEDPMHFCSGICMSEYFGGRRLDERPRRVP
jgi:hypothetical protein